MHGVVVIDKPPGITSHSVVSRVRRALGVARAGHTGTLDPLATGVLPVCLGDATKLAVWLQADDKAYEAEIIFGIETATLDADGAVTARAPEAAAAVTADALRAALAARVGAALQVPPMYSAVRVGRRRLHQIARSGEIVERAARPITIHALELVAFGPSRATIRVACSKGTYVRSLVDDVGHDLGCGAHLAGLRRTVSGQFTIAQALRLDELTVPAARAALVDPTDALTLRRVEVPAALVLAVRTAYKAAIASLVEDMPEGEVFQLVGPDRALLAVARRDAGHLRFERVFAHAPAA